MRSRRSTGPQSNNPENHCRSPDGEDSLSDPSKASVDRLLKRAGSGKARAAKGRQEARAGELLTENVKGKYKEELIQDFNLKRCASKNVDRSTSGKEGAQGGSTQCDLNDFDWEEGSISVPQAREGYSHDLGEAVTVEFTDLPSSAQRKPSRRASAEEKALSELMHKVHFLCLLARGRLVDRVCDDRLIQASLLSLLPSYLLKLGEVPRLTAKMLGSLVRWFHDNFRIRSQKIDKGSIKSNLTFALESREGTIEEIAALSVALFRALNLMTRFVSIMDVISLKPDPDPSGGSNQDAPRLDTKICSSTYNVASPNCVHSQYSFHSASGHTNEDMIHETSQIGKQPKGGTITSCKKNLLNDLSVRCQSDDGSSHATASKAYSDKFDSCATMHTRGPKRKGDAEFELQMEMALAATAVGVHDTTVESSSISSLTPPFKRTKTIKTEVSLVAHGNSSAVWSRKIGPPMYWAEVYCSGEKPSGRWVHIDAANAIIDGEDKVEAAAAAWRRPLKYVVAFAGNGAKDVTRRYCMHWYKISSQRVSSQWLDSVLAPLKVLEADAARSTFQLDAFQDSTKNGQGAELSEGTTPLDVDSADPTESSPKEYPDHPNSTDGLGIEASEQLDQAMDLESRSEYPAISCRDSLEDLELETRALTEPLPTNQLAYKNHHLYAIERWLTKNQTLHPKGPLLGYCSGHPVYPRSCVQTLQTKQRWLREGLQVRANEIPAKVVKRSRKSGKLQPSEPVFSEEDDGEAAIELYGKWQLELLQLPHAVNGIVPKNDRGQVDVWSEKCLPPGTVHLRLPRIFTVARRLEIDYAPAMVGFEFRNGRSIPIFEGIVVCTEFKDAILEAYTEEMERREAEEKKRHESEALSRWFQLLSSIVTRQRLENSYGDCSTSVSASHETSSDRKADRSVHLRNSHQDNILPREAPRGSVEGDNSSWQSAQDHEHVFPTEDQSFDEESFIRTKRCPCGFSIQVEEL